MRDLEHLIAIAFYRWWILWSNTKKIPTKLLHAIPNGGARHPAVAAKLKAEGVQPGVSDYFLAYPKDGYHGLYLELKSEDGRATKEQMEFGAAVTGMGYKFRVVKGTDQAMRAIEEYLK